MSNALITRPQPSAESPDEGCPGRSWHGGARPHIVWTALMPRTPRRGRRYLFVEPPNGDRGQMPREQCSCR